MMLMCNSPSNIKKWDRQRITTEPDRQNLSAFGNMLLHDGKLFFSKLARLLKNSVWNPQLAYIMKRRRESNHVSIFSCVPKFQRKLSRAYPDSYQVFTR